MPHEDRDKRRASFYRTFALAMELPFIPVVAVVLGGGLGYLLDKRLHTDPWFTLALGALGFVAGIREILRRLKSREDGK